MTSDSLYNDAPPPSAEKTSFLDDLIEFLPAPSKVYARLANKGSFAIFALVCVLIIGFYFANRGAMQSIFDGEYDRQMAQVMKQNPGMTQEQLAAGRGFAEMAQNFGIIIGIPLILVCIGIATWVTGKIFGAELTFGQAFMVGSWAYVPRIIESLVVTIQGLVLDVASLTGRFQLSVGVGRFLDPDMDPGILSLLGRVDVFTIWVCALIAIGISVVGKVPRDKLIPIALVTWTFGALPAIWAIVWGALQG